MLGQPACLGHLESDVGGGAAALLLCLQNGWTPLHLAAYNCSGTAVRTLLEYGANLEAVNSVSYPLLLLLLVCSMVQQLLVCAARSVA